jgi:beta-lactamase superfamily II metal-dependent hydrolase
MLVAGEPLKTDILKVGHHGSCSATGLPFLQAAQPAVGIYSAGINNPYGHPCAATINKLHQFGVLVQGTDVNGSMIATVTENGYRITNTDVKDLR